MISEKVEIFVKRLFLFSIIVFNFDEASDYIFYNQIINSN